MDKKSRHSNSNWEQYLKYFRNLFPGRERHIFEKKMLQDKFDMEAFEGLSQFTAEELSSDVHELNKKIRSRSQTRTIAALPFIRYAAAILLLAGTGAAIYFVRQSAKNTMELATLDIREDSSLIRKSIQSDDSLKENITYIPTAAKEKKEERISDIEPVVSEVTSIQIVESPETVQSLIAQDEVASGEDMKREESPGIDSETKEKVMEEVYYQIEESHLKEEAIRQHHRKGQIQAEQSKAASPSGTQNDRPVVTGRVISAADETPMPGVNIVIKGTGTGTVSDIEGNFQIALPPGDSSILQFASIGYATEEIEISSYDNVTVALSEDLIALEEVVVIGYGTVKHPETTGAISSITNGDELNAAPVMIPPNPVGGLSAYKLYIRENIDYTRLPSFEKPVLIKLSFSVNRNGTIQNIAIRKSAGETFDREAIRLVKEGPAWNPGTEDGIPVTRELTIKIKLEPQESVRP